MAKCIQVVGQGIPVRMSDDDAFQVVVRDHDGEYCSKRVWKEHRASKGGDNCLAKLVGTRITATDTLARRDQHARRR